VKVAVIPDRTHNPFGEAHWVSCLRENLTSSSYGEGLETGRASTQTPRQSFTRQPLFHNLKRWWGVANLWQQSRKALELWMQIRSTAWTLAQLLALVAEDSFPIQDVAPWRAKQPLTAGLIAQWLRIEFTGLPFRDGFDRKSQKFTFPEQRGDPGLRL
jgi:hypothetical protein